MCLLFFLDQFSKILKEYRPKLVMRIILFVFGFMITICVWYQFKIPPVNINIYPEIFYKQTNYDFEVLNVDLQSLFAITVKIHEPAIGLDFNFEFVYKHCSQNPHGIKLLIVDKISDYILGISYPDMNCILVVAPLVSQAHILGVLAHELGHIMGLSHTDNMCLDLKYPNKSSHPIMSPTLNRGVRNLAWYEDCSIKKQPINRAANQSVF